MENLPVHIFIIFFLATAATVIFFYKAAGSSKNVMAVMLVWLVVQAAIGASGFYQKTDTMPPRFLLLIIPPLVLIVILFATSFGKIFLDQLDIKMLTWLHVVRVPVELTLFGLFLYEYVPQLMTFEGRNYDIAAGITAPFVAYFGLRKYKHNNLVLSWNILCLALLLNIVAHGVLSVPTPFQKFAFDQPNVALGYFPFVWLPCFIVPIVLLAHLVSIRHLIKNKQSQPAIQLQ